MKSRTIGKQGWLLGILLLGTFSSGCQSKQSCGWATQLGPWALKQNWSGCSDGQVRSVECRRVATSYQCQCLVGTGVGPDGTVGARVLGSFTVADLASLSSRESSTNTVNARCNLNLAP